MPREVSSLRERALVSADFHGGGFPASFVSHKIARCV